MPTKEMEDMLRMFKTYDVYKKLEDEQYKMTERMALPFPIAIEAWN
jgi:hypothetical protein